MPDNVRGCHHPRYYLPRRGIAPRRCNYNGGRPALSDLVIDRLASRWTVAD
jgi:hypothetical protein